MSQPDSMQHHLSLLHGWVPVLVQIVAALALVAAIGWRNRRWRLLWVPWSVFIGAALALGTYWYIDSEGLADQPAPRSLWVWIALTGTAAGVLVAGWRGAAWWRRAVAVSAVPLCLLSAGLVVNLWTGYLPTVQTAWSQLTARPLPDQTDLKVVTAMQQQHRMPATGTVVPIDTGDAASGFRHRQEFVYLPPAWFATTPPPPLPTVMMIGGEFNTPADWMRTGNAISIADTFAAAHRGNAPVLVFVDVGGAFNNDTECVDGPRGRSADHLTGDVRPYVISHFGVSADRTDWGIVGWSMGGTCAVDLSVMHPDLFSAFVDIAGDRTPNSGTRQQTVDRLFGGNSAAAAAFDPSTVIARHGRYTDLAGWFDTNTKGAQQVAAATALCGLGTAHGMACSVITEPGQHDWPFADHVFAASLPWLASQLGTPSVPLVPLPRGTPTATPVTTTALAR